MPSEKKETHDYRREGRLVAVETKGHETERRENKKPLIHFLGGSSIKESRKKKRCRNRGTWGKRMRLRKRGPPAKTSGGISGKKPQREKGKRAVKNLEGQNPKK